MRMKSEGLISKNTYSIYLNGVDDFQANIVFGGVDHAKYSNQLTLLPMIKSGSDYSRVAVTLTGLKFVTSENETEVTGAKSFAILDTGSTYTSMPSKYLQGILSQLSNVKYSSSLGYYIFPCSEANSNSLVFDLQGLNIQIPLSDFLIYFSTSNGKSRGWCALDFQTMSDDNMVILGDDFLAGLYTVVDLDSNVVAISLADLTSNDENIEAITDSIPSATQAPLYSETWTA
ncbi:unnamed protein product [Ambrosiozyma monospora]|uniref:Unnamed protein product n=1 Tax=Ambrosiozyma monospora TaxID=43982 RepID=A0ACB5TC80_AMBMO|nr:unnamed protein product [Ambrosiozyma monospora]